MDITSLTDRLNKIREATANATHDINAQVAKLESGIHDLAQHTTGHQTDPFIIGLTVFVLACFVGYYVVWKVTPALHSPLMSVTNAISSVIVVGAIIAAGPALAGISTSFGFVAVVLASINIFGGFIVTQRMLQMFSKKKGE
jgi:NAD(P) transhydrogenase subunit alpha